MEKFEELKQMIASIDEDVDKFYTKGNKAAGTRVRKILQEVKKLAQEVRIHIQETKKAE